MRVFAFSRSLEAILLAGAAVHLVHADPPFLYDHELGAFEAYAQTFAECIKRFSGE